jgi:hypothetical protein
VAALFLLSLAWVFANPLLATPDESAHWNYGIALWEDQEISRNMLLPEWAVTAEKDLICIAGPNAVETCQNKRLFRDGSAYQAVFMPAGAYPRIWPQMISSPQLLVNGDAAFYLMRIANLFLCFLILSAGAWNLLKKNSLLGLLLITIALPPFAIYLFSSINPSGIEIASLAGAGLTMVNMRREASFERKSKLSVILVFQLALGMTAKSSSPLLLPFILLGFMIYGNDVKNIPRYVFDKARNLFYVTAIFGLAVFNYLPFITLLKDERKTLESGLLEAQPIGVWMPESIGQILPRLNQLPGYFGSYQIELPIMGSALYLIFWLSILTYSLKISNSKFQKGVHILVIVLAIISPITYAATLFQNANLYQARYILAGLLFVLVICCDAIVVNMKNRQIALRKNLVVGVASISFVIQVYVLCYAFIWYRAVKPLSIESLAMSTLETTTGLVAACLSLLAIVVFATSIFNMPKELAPHKAR